jgi:hypothetical protein
MASEFSITQIVISIKEDGQLISATAREPSGLQTQKTNSEDSIRVIGRMILSKVAELCSISKGTDMMECGWIIYPMVKEE